MPLALKPPQAVFGKITCAELIQTWPASMRAATRSARSGSAVTTVATRP